MWRRKTKLIACIRHRAGGGEPPPPETRKIIGKTKILDKIWATLPTRRLRSPNVGGLLSEMKRLGKRPTTAACEEPRPNLRRQKGTSHPPVKAVLARLASADADLPAPAVLFQRGVEIGAPADNSRFCESGSLS